MVSDYKKNCALSQSVYCHCIFMVDRREIRLIEGNAKYCHLKKLICTGTLWQVFICLRPRTSYPTTLQTVYVYTEYLFTQGRWRGGGRVVEPERRWEEQNFTKLDRQKYQHDWLYLQSKNSDKHLPQSTFIGQFF